MPDEERRPRPFVEGAPPRSDVAERAYETGIDEGSIHQAGTDDAPVDEDRVDEAVINEAATDEAEVDDEFAQTGTDEAEVDIVFDQTGTDAAESGVAKIEWAEGGDPEADPAGIDEAGIDRDEIDDGATEPAAPFPYFSHWPSVRPTVRRSMAEEAARFFSFAERLRHEFGGGAEGAAATVPVDRPDPADNALMGAAQQPESGPAPDDGETPDDAPAATLAGLEGGGLAADAGDFEGDAPTRVPTGTGSDAFADVPPDVEDNAFAAVSPDLGDDTYAGVSERIESRIKGEESQDLESAADRDDFYTGDDGYGKEPEPGESTGDDHSPEGDSSEA